MIYSTRRFVFCLTLSHFVLVVFSLFIIAITSLGEERANLTAFRTFVRFVLVLICRFPLPLGVWEGVRFVIVALPGLFSYLFFFSFLWTPPSINLHIYIILLVKHWMQEKKFESFFATLPRRLIGFGMQVIIINYVPQEFQVILSNGLLVI